MADYADADGCFWKGQRHLMQRLSMSESTVRRHILQLEADGYLTRHRRNHRDGSRADDGYQLALQKTAQDIEAARAAREAAEPAKPRPIRKPRAVGDPVATPSPDDLVRLVGGMIAAGFQVAQVAAQGGVCLVIPITPENAEKLSTSYRSICTVGEAVLPVNLKEPTGQFDTPSFGVSMRPLTPEPPGNLPFLTGSSQSELPDAPRRAVKRKNPKSNGNASAADRRGLSPGQRKQLRFLMAELRKLNYSVDRSAGSIVKRIVCRGYGDEFEVAARGLAGLRDRGELRDPLGIGVGHELHPRILWSKKEEARRHWWQEAQHHVAKTAVPTARGAEQVSDILASLVAGDKRGAIPARSTTKAAAREAG